LWTLVTGWRGVPGARSTPPWTRRRIVWSNHPIGTGNLRDEALRFGIVDAAQFVLVIEVRAAVLDNGETLAVERQTSGNRPGVILNYPAPMADKPMNLAYDPPPGVARSNGVPEPHRMTIYQR
jgi:hypothetical protein